CRRSHWIDVRVTGQRVHRRLDAGGLPIPASTTGFACPRTRLRAQVRTARAANPEPTKPAVQVAGGARSESEQPSRHVLSREALLGPGAAHQDLPVHGALVRPDLSREPSSAETRSAERGTVETPTIRCSYAG